MKVIPVGTLEEAKKALKSTRIKLIYADDTYSDRSGFMFKAKEHLGMMDIDLIILDSGLNMMDLVVSKEFIAAANSGRLVVTLDNDTEDKASNGINIAMKIKSLEETKKVPVTVFSGRMGDDDITQPMAFANAGLPDEYRIMGYAKPDYDPLFKECIIPTIVEISLKDGAHKLSRALPKPAATPTKAHG